MIKTPVQRLFLLVFILSLGLGYSRGWAALLARDTGIGLVYIGLMETVAIVVALVLRYPIGVLIDRVGAKPFILAGCVSSAAACALYLSRIGPVAFLIGSGIDTLSLLIMHISLFSTALVLVEKSQKGLFFSRYNIADQSGGIVLPFIAGFLASRFSLELLFRIDLVASIVMLGFFALFFPSSKQGSRQTLRSALSRLLDLRQAQKKILALLVGIEVLLGASTGLFSVYLAVYAHEVLGMDYSVIGIVLSLSVLAFLLGSYKMGKYIDVWGPVKSWIISSMVYGCLLIALGFSVSIWSFIAIYCLTLVAQSIQVPAYQSLLPFILPAGREGQITGLAGNVMKISMLSAAPLGAIVWERYDASLIFVLAGVLMFLSIIPCWIFLRSSFESEVKR